MIFSIFASYEKYCQKLYILNDNDEKTQINALFCGNAHPIISIGRQYNI